MASTFRFINLYNYTQVFCINLMLSSIIGYRSGISAAILQITKLRHGEVK